MYNVDVDFLGTENGHGTCIENKFKIYYDSNCTPFFRSIYSIGQVN